MLHFTPYAEDWSKLPVIVSGEGSYVTDDKANTYIDGLAGSLYDAGRARQDRLADAAHKQMKELGFFPDWSFQHPRSLELAQKLAEIAPGDLSSLLLRLLWIGGCGDGYQAGTAVSLLYGRGAALQGDLAQIAYHGTTMGALSVTGIPYFRRLSSLCCRASCTQTTPSRTPREPPTPSRRP